MESESYSVGKKIRFYRLRAQMTMKELALQARITVSMLSQIENGQANPSLNTLRLLAKSLNIPLFLLFVDQEERMDDVQVIESDHQHHLIRYGVDYTLLTPDLQGKIEFCVVSLTKGSMTANEMMDHDAEETAYVLEGCVKLVTSSGVYALKKGDSVRMKPKIKHLWHNASDEDAKIIFAVSPPTF